MCGRQQKIRQRNESSYTSSHDATLRDKEASNDKIIKEHEDATKQVLSVRQEERDRKLAMEVLKNEGAHAKRMDQGTQCTDMNDGLSSTTSKDTTRAGKEPETPDRDDNVDPKEV